MKISQVVKLFWLDKKLEFSPNTVKTYTYTFNYLINFLKDCEFEKITVTEIKEFVLYLQEERELSKRSLFDSVSRISSLWTFASSEFKIPHIFAEKKITIKFTEPIIEPYSKIEIEKLIHFSEYKLDYKTKTGKKVRSKRYTHLLDKAIILTLLDSGVRVTELCNFVVSDYDKESGRLLVRTAKNNKQRFVIVGLMAQKAIYKYCSSRVDIKQNEPLFATMNNSHFDKNNIRHKLDAISKAANVTNVHPHRFRHTFAIQFLRNGGNVFVLKELLGHSTLEMVKHYARIAQTDIDSATKYSIADNWKIR